MAEQAARPQRVRGSTVLEVLIALALLATAVAGFTQLLLLTLATESRAAWREGATLLLADAHELQQAFSAMPPAVRINEWQANVRGLRPADAYVVTAALQRLPDPAAALTRLRGSVHWSDAGSDQLALTGAAYSLPAVAPP